MTSNGAVADVLGLPNTALILGAIVEYPDFNAKELAHRTGLTAGTVSIYLTRFAAAGLITRTRKSGLILNRATEAGGEALERLKQPAGGAA